MQRIVCKCQLLIFILLFPFVSIGQIAQVEWFVSTTGSDVTGDGTIGAPFKTVAKACSYLTPGDILYVRGGTYYNANYGNGDAWKEEQTADIANVNGTASQYITIKPYNGEHVIFRGDANFIVQIRTSSYLIFEGFEVYGVSESLSYESALDYQFLYRETVNDLAHQHERLPRGTNTDQTGLPDLSGLTIFRPTLYTGHGLIVQSSNHIYIQNNLVHHTPGEGIRFAGSDYINIIGNEVHNSAHRTSGGVHGISGYTQRSIDNNDGVKIIISHNNVHDNYCEIASWSENKTIFTATVDEGKGITIQRANTKTGWQHGRIQIDNNISYNNGFSGVHVNDGERVDILNNTCYYNCRTGQGNNIGISVGGGNDIKIVNNIVETNLSFGGYSISVAQATNLNVQYNLVNGGLDPDLTGIAQNTIIGSATYNNAAAFDYSLQFNSLGIDAGNNAYAPLFTSTDYANNARIVGTIDLGAFEYSTALPITFGNISAIVKDDKVIVNWSTLKEINNKYFEIEISDDGTNMRKIATVFTKATNGNSDTEIKYEYIGDVATQSLLMGLPVLAFLFIILIFFGRYKKLKMAYGIGLVFIFLFALTACTKNDVTGTKKENKTYVKIVQVDKDGSRRYSKVITAIND